MVVSMRLKEFYDIELKPEFRVLQEEWKEMKKQRENNEMFHNKMNSRRKPLKYKKPISVIKMRVFSRKAK